MFRVAPLAVVASLCLPLPAFAEDAPGTAGGRFVLEKAGDGFIRLDRQTGAVSRCLEKSGNWACESIADDSAVANQQAATGLVGEDEAGEPGDRQGVGQASEHGHADEHHQGRAELVEHGGNPQARPMAVTARSISLMPTNGTTIPPRP